MKDQLGILAVIVVTAIIIVMMLWNKAYAYTLHDTTKPHVCYTQGKAGVWVITPNGTYCQTK